MPAACSAQVKIGTFNKMLVEESVSERFDSIDVQDTDAAQTTVIDVEAAVASHSLITIRPVVTEVDDIAVADVSINQALSGPIYI